MKDEEQQSLFGSGSVVDVDHAKKFETPTVDTVPVVHAHWNCIENVVSYEGTFDAYECSHCHKSFLDDLCENNGSDYVNAKNDFKYCPFCGAKMDGERK